MAISIQDTLEGDSPPARLLAHSPALRGLKWLIEAHPLPGDDPALLQSYCDEYLRLSWAWRDAETALSNRFSWEYWRRVCQPPRHQGGEYA